MKLTKIRLINWHLFTDNTIFVNGNLLITGDNGNGKSTLVDAIFYVLSGGDERHFNSAANDQSKRTLTSYLRGELGYENKEFLRTEPSIVSHIALEFYDSDDDVYNVLGCVIAIENTSTPRSKFYIALNSCVDDLSFMSEAEGVFDFDYFKTFNVEADISDLENSNSKGFAVKRAKIASFLNITDNENYYDLLTKAIAFKPTDVSDFVCRFILKEDDVKIDSLALELAKYREIQETIIAEKTKLEYLETFIDKAKQFVSYKKDLAYLDVLKKQERVTEMQVYIAKSDKKILELNQNIQNINFEIDGLDGDLKRISEEIGRFESSGEFKGLKEKTDKLHELKKNKTELEEKIETVESDLIFDQDIMPRLGLKYDFLKDVKSENIVLLNKHIEEYILELNNLEKNLGIETFALDREKESCERNKSKIIKTQELLSQRRNKYDAKVEELIDLIKKQLKEKYYKDIPVLTLCECIEIVDKEWTDAVEGYLGFQRFDLILPPKYFIDASVIYERYAREKRLYEVGVVNTGIESEERVLTNSLYSKIRVINPYAEKICQRLLGKVICVDSVKDFKPGLRCITKSCMKYINDTTRAINPKFYEMPYIGEGSFERRRQILAEQLQNEELKLSNLHKRLREIDSKKRLIQESKISRRKDKNVENFWAQLKLLTQEIENLNKEIREATQDVDMVSLTNKYTALKERQTVLESHLTSLKDKRAKLDKQCLGEQIDKTNKQKELENASQIALSAFNALSDKEAFAIFKSEIETTGVTLSIEIARREKIIDRIQDAIKNGMREYVKSYNANLFAEIDCVNDFIAEYNKIKGWGFVHSEASAEAAFKTAQKSFNENFVAKLRYKFKCVKQELDRINDNLKNHPFGRDGEIFEFTYQASGEQEMQDYVRIITSGKEIIQQDLFTESLDSKDLAIMQGLFDKLAKIGNPSQHEKDLDKYLDYRSYFRYDIVIINKDKARIPFSKTYRKRSGGEMQTPFYVILGACFDQLIKRDEFTSSACLVAFDEAFNNMDESRILTLMKYYKKLNIQLIIVVPTNHSKEIIPCVGTTVSLKKENNYIYETYLINE